MCTSKSAQMIFTAIIIIVGLSFVTEAKLKSKTKKTVEQPTQPAEQQQQLQVGTTILPELEETSQQSSQEVDSDSKPQECKGVYLGTTNYLGAQSRYLPPNVSAVTPEGCTAEKIWIMGSHGTANPGEGAILEMKNEMPLLRDLIREHAKNASLCPPELDEILKWTPNSKLNVSDQHLLVEQGYQEWRGVSNRFQQKFPNLFPTTFTNNSYQIRASSDQSIQESAKAFATSIFGESLPGVLIKSISTSGTCEKYNQQVRNNPRIYSEPINFMKSLPFKQGLAVVGQRLGLGRDVTEKEMAMMYKTCAHETSLNPQKQSPWCAVFDEDVLEALEFKDDLESYYLNGYAHTITYESICAPIVDAVYRFNGKYKSPVVAYFVPTKNVLKLYARLGLFKDSGNLTSNSFANYHHDSRQWVNSRIGKSASNIALVLFNCTGSNGSNTEQKIGILVQEEPTPLPACNGTWLCPYSTFLENVKGFIDKCNVTEICKV